MLVNNRSISDSLLKLRACAATQHVADDHEEEPSLKDIELGDSKRAVISRRSREILDLKKYWCNEIRSILSPKNIAKSKEVLFLKTCGCEVLKFFLRKFKGKLNIVL